MSFHYKKHDTYRALIRSINSAVKKDSILNLFRKEGISALPSVLPDDMSGYIIYAYCSMWSYLDNTPPGPELDPLADEAASYIDAGLLDSSLWEVLSNGNTDRELIIDRILSHPRLLLPWLRFGRYAPY